MPPEFPPDGKLDLLVVPGSGGTFAVLLGNGDGTFQAPVTYTAPVASYLVLGDFNGDGKPDIAFSNSRRCFGSVGREVGGFRLRSHNKCLH